MATAMCILAATALADLFYIENPNLDPDHTGGTLLGGNTNDWTQNGQTFSLTQTAYLVSAEFYIYETALPDSPDRITATIRIADDLYESSIISVTGFTLTAGTEFSLFDFGYILLQPGDYAITVASDTLEPYVIMSMPYNLTNWPDAPGVRLASGDENGPFVEMPGDLRYRFTFDTVPEPGTITLVIIGIGSLTVLRKARKKNHAEQGGCVVRLTRVVPAAEHPSRQVSPPHTADVRPLMTT